MDQPNAVSSALTLRRLVTAGIALALLFLLFPGFDIWAAGLFYVPGEEFPLGRVGIVGWLHDQGTPLLWIGGMALTLIVYGLNRWRGTNILQLRERGLLFVLLCLALGPGLLVNVVLKDHWGRARPAQIEAFGGDSAYSPPLILADQCDHNCSFVAGDPSAGFFYLSIAMLNASVPGAIAATVLGLGLGVLRMAAGGHFLSDVLFCGLAMAAIIRLLHLLLIEPGGRDEIRAWWHWASRSTSGRLSLALIAVTGAIMLSALDADRPIAIWAHDLPAWLHWVMNEVTQLGVSTSWLIASGEPVILFWLFRGQLEAGVRQRLQSLAYLPLFVFCAVAGAGLANDAIKGIAGRFRPKLFFLDQRYGFDLWHKAADYTSFPSGHTAVIFSLATALALIWRPLAWPGFAVAFLVGASRILIGAHWPSDVLGGAWLGIAWTLWVHHLFVTHGVRMSEARVGRAEWQGSLLHLPGFFKRKQDGAPCAPADR
jgi:lipid A 4'-phosphatase